MFILHLDDRSLTTTPSGGPGASGDSKGADEPTTLPLNPVEEMQLLLNIHSQLEEQKNIEMRYCIFDAIFGGAGSEVKVSIGCSVWCGSDAVKLETIVAKTCLTCFKSPLSKYCIQTVLK